MKFVLRILIVIICFVPMLLLGQSPGVFKMIGQYGGDIVDFTVDNLDNVYLVSSTNQIKKLDANGDSAAVYNDVRKYGKVSYMDVSNPMRILFYYKDFSTVVTLDRFLNVRSTIDLRKSGIYQTQSIGLAYDNGIWLFDEQENKLRKIDEAGTLLIETPDFRQLFQDIPVPQSITDHDGYVYLYDSARGIFVFDYYGAYKNRIDISHWDNLRVMNKYIFGTNKGSLKRYDIKTLVTQEQKLPADLTTVAGLQFTTTRLYALRKDNLQIYSLQ